MPLPGARHPYLSPDTDRVRVNLDAVCRTCKTRHRLGRTPQGFVMEMWQWYERHQRHDIEYLSPRRRLPRRFRDKVSWLLGWAPWWLGVRENANILIEWGASTTLTVVRPRSPPVRRLSPAVPPLLWTIRPMTT